VWEIYAESGSFVAENQPIARLYRPGDMKIEAHLLSEDSLSLSPGQTVSCLLADNTSFEAEIVFVSSVALETLSTIGITENRCLVELRPQNLPAQIGAGHPVDLTFSSPAVERALSVPASAVMPMGAGNGIYILRDGRALLTEVQTGLHSGGRVEILSGLSEGDSVILDPHDTGIADNSRVTAQ
jgi:HlyD family secretion protein